MYSIALLWENVLPCSVVWSESCVPPNFTFSNIIVGGFSPATK